MNEKISISLSISKKLLDRIKKDVSGKDLSEKLQRCCEIGFKILNRE